jgi:hypothetical protein
MVSWMEFFIVCGAAGRLIADLDELVAAATWPVYSKDNPQNFVFDANVTSYVEPDIFRAEGINYMIENMASVFGR